MRGVGVNLHLKDHTVVLHYNFFMDFIIKNLGLSSDIQKFSDLNVAFLRVLHLVPAQIVTEAPVVLLYHTRFDSPELTTNQDDSGHLGVEEMGDLPGELGAVPLVDQPQVRSCVAAPCRGLGFTIAL